MTEPASGNILIVDDEALVRNLIERIIEKAGFACVSVATGEEALEVIRDTQVSVVITDIRLPGINGLELVARVKESHDIDVIVVTGDGDHHSYEEAVNKGASDFILKPIRNEELVLRVRRVLEERDMRNSRARMLRDLEQLVITDGLTQLYNSRHFFNQMEVEIGRSSRYNHALSFLMMDIDHFKHYNDTHGHLAGDKVLVRIGQLIMECLRKTDSAYRYGGEEFAAILPETALKDAVHVADRIRATVEAEELRTDGKAPVNITLSVGVTQYCPNESSADFIQRADEAMYQSKANGRNAVSVIDAKQV